MHLDILTSHRKRLVAQIAALSESHRGIVDAVTDVATDDEHDPEGHTIAFEREQQAALLYDAEAQLVALDEAIDRFRSGTFGLCDRCGATIPGERLDAVPATTRCVRCADR